MDIDAAVSVEGGDTAVLLEAARIGGQFDEADLFRPVARPVSASSRPYRSSVYRRISVDVSEVEPKVTMRPAACHVVPEVSLSRSRSTTSVQPR